MPALPSSHYYLGSLSWTSRTFDFPDPLALLALLVPLVLLVLLALRVPLVLLIFHCMFMLFMFSDFLGRLHPSTTTIQKTLGTPWKAPDFVVPYAAHFQVLSSSLFYLLWARGSFKNLGRKSSLQNLEKLDGLARQERSEVWGSGTTYSSILTEPDANLRAVNCSCSQDHNDRSPPLTFRTY